MPEAIEPRVIESGVVVPEVIEPRVIESGLIVSGLSARFFNRVQCVDFRLDVEKPAQIRNVATEPRDVPLLLTVRSTTTNRVPHPSFARVEQHEPKLTGLVSRREFTHAASNV